ncbi:MAG TPA: nodulation protein NfeD [Thermoanaerobaculia bacterium]|nr:nodulation protein NfeD [Thermoanaerobaculia bacterium]
MKRSAIIPLFLLLLATAGQAAVLHITVDDAIHPMSDEFIGRALDDAAKAHDEAVVIELRTPGGLSDSMRSIVQNIVKSPVPVIVFVGPAGSRAASAGFFILEAADVAAMAPGTNTGAAHPVILGEKMDDIMKTKLENDAAAFMRSIAEKRGRNVAVAETAVRESKSFTEQEALKQKLIDVVAPDLPSLLKAIDGRAIKRFDGSTITLHVAGKPVRTNVMTLKERVLSTLMDPNVAFILLALGALALWAEFNHPGAVVPGVVGLISILLAVFALNLLPTRFASLALLLAAFVLFALEAKFATHGVLGVGGIVAMIFGGLFLVDGPIPEMRVHLITALVVSVPIGAIAVFLMTLVLRARKNRVATGPEGMIGEIGVARTALGPDGTVDVHGEIWNATAKTAVPEGARVRIRGVNGLHLIVEPE